jgi:hypothetical protein
MSSFFQLFFAWGVLLLLILSFYLIDKINTMYRLSVPAEIPKTYSDGLFGELVGKPLWDSMSGMPIPTIDPKLVENLRPHYEPVLRQHIEQVFMEGFKDAQAGRAGIPSNNRQIPTPRGSLESWLPLHHLASIYQVGAELAQNKPSERLRLQQSLDQVTSMLYARTNLELKEPYSESLMRLPIEQGLIAEYVEPQAPESQIAAAYAATLPGTDGAQGEGASAENTQKLNELAASLSDFDPVGSPQSEGSAQAGAAALAGAEPLEGLSVGGKSLPQPTAV